MQKLHFLQLLALKYWILANSDRLVLQQLPLTIKQTRFFEKACSDIFMSDANISCNWWMKKFTGCTACSGDWFMVSVINFEDYNSPVCWLHPWYLHYFLVIKKSIFFRLYLNKYLILFLLNIFRLNQNLRREKQANEGN